ncbi:MAG: hypothetical protein AB7L13_16260 [Acidimicrobiia bacterium]
MGKPSKKTRAADLGLITMATRWTLAGGAALSGAFAYLAATADRAAEAAAADPGDRSTGVASLVPDRTRSAGSDERTENEPLAEFTNEAAEPVTGPGGASTTMSVAPTTSIGPKVPASRASAAMAREATAATTSEDGKIVSIEATAGAPSTAKPVASTARVATTSTTVAGPDGSETTETTETTKRATSTTKKKVPVVTATTRRAARSGGS